MKTTGLRGFFSLRLVAILVSLMAFGLNAGALPLVKVTSPDPYALEGASSGAFTIVRDSGTTANLDVNFQIKGTAVNGVDYLEITNVVTIPAGFSAVDIVVTPIAQLVNHSTKTVVLTLLTLETNATYALGSHRSATVKIVDEVFNNVAPSVKITSPTNNTIFSVPGEVSIAAEASDSDGAIRKVIFYANDKVIGTATNSPYTLLWSGVHPGKYAIFARAMDEFEKSTLSAAVHIAVTNPPPTVSLLSPTNSSVFGIHANVAIEAAATDADGISKVSFFVDGRLLGSRTNPPYSLVWTNVALGRHTVVAQATDTYGQSALSATAKITISNVLPVVSITSPTSGKVFPANTPVVLEAQASDADGGIKQVSFFTGNHNLGTVTTAPYSVLVTGLKAGSYSIIAKATDTAGQTVASKPVKITISR